MGIESRIGLWMDVPAHVIYYDCDAEAMVGREEDVFEKGGFAASLDGYYISLCVFENVGGRSTKNPERSVTGSFLLLDGAGLSSAL